MSTEKNKNKTIEYINKQQKNVSFGRNLGELPRVSICCDSLLLYS